MTTRFDEDLLGQRELPSDCLWGVHTERARENFPLSGRSVHSALIKAYGQVKLACAQVNRDLGVWKLAPEKADAIERACREMIDGELDEVVVVDALQGGAGTSTNMNVNEVLANRSLQFLGKEPGEVRFVSPNDDLNRHQSTNDTYPTALRIASMAGFERLEQAVVELQQAFQAKEHEFAHIVKVGRTQLQDAVLTTLGREMSAYADALSRDRWRIYKCNERLRVVNLGGTAIGSGLGAPRQFIFRVTDVLREITGYNLARAENLVDGTQNADVFVEVSGIARALACSLKKISNDLRLLSSGPDAGLGELILPARQAGSSIMPGKVNPVIPEAVIQVAWRVEANDLAITQAAGAGALELNPFLPLVADCLLENIDLLARACDTLRAHCVEGLRANEERCRRHVENSTAAATALVGPLGYDRVSALVKQAHAEGRSVRELVIESGLMTTQEFAEAITPEAVCRLGS